MLNAKVQYDEAGKPTSSFAFMKDITEQKKSERKIVLQNNKLKELNSTKDKLMSIIAHDLRSPFNSIIGFSELLIHKLDVNSDTDIKDYASMILLSANQCNTLLGNLFELGHGSNR